MKPVSVKPATSGPSREVEALSAALAATREQRASGRRSWAGGGAAVAWFVSITHFVNIQRVMLF